MKMDTYMLHHMVQMIVAGPELVMRDPDEKPHDADHPTLGERLSSVWDFLVRGLVVRQEVLEYCIAHPGECHYQ